LAYSGLENSEYQEAAKNAGNSFLVIAVLSPLFTPPHISSLLQPLWFLITLFFAAGNAFYRRYFAADADY
jgi:hypothetical protein